eukprot:3666700-Lingulodinium_polyedra.AAC.1
MKSILRAPPAAKGQVWFASGAAASPKVCGGLVPRRPMASASPWPLASIRSSQRSPMPGIGGAPIL